MINMQLCVASSLDTKPTPDFKPESSSLEEWFLETLKL